jgi:hypothetical protein
MVFSRSPADQFQEQMDLLQCMCLRRSLIFLACGGTTHQFSGIAAMAWIGSQLPFA